ncbi:hypothetical protein BDN72DRAFT_858581 [Pluteus cervinus]|uniref:Uncharacterized protein n=1 Tax=Pluteus cervinus TaxID=181527 RepID=A0ACD3ASA0_9AGAR|nr:hypothetical protein BDN72DRAFT_858581 [Pluteus cervinus]
MSDLSIDFAAEGAIALITDQLDEDAKMLAPQFDPLKHNITWDAGSVLRPPLPTRPGVIGFTPQNSAQKSREALGVWRQTNLAYKLFGTKNQYDRNVRDIQTAQANGLPYANATVVEGLVYTYESPPAFKTKTGFAIIATWYDRPWEFFCAQGNWKPGFENLIKKTNKAGLQSIKAAFQTAVRLGVTDPQGFINPNVTTAGVQFIDIHYGSSAGKTQEMLDVVNKYA